MKASGPPFFLEIWAGGTERWKAAGPGRKESLKMANITRRVMIKCAAGAAGMLGASFGARAQQASGGSITDVEGIKVGHFTDRRRPTGCTVILAEEGAVAGVDVRGSAPGTRETDLLDPVNLVQQVHAVVLSGGSAFGLDAAGGVMRYLDERGIGFKTEAAVVPIVPAAILYDLGVGDARIRPDAEAGYKAASAAVARHPGSGNIGAGAGATVGKLFGTKRAMKGGIGTSSIRIEDRRSKASLTVGAIIAVNAAGDVIDPAAGRVIAGARTEDGRAVRGTLAAILAGDPLPELLGGSATTIGIVATDARLDKAQAKKIAQMAHDGLARTINPIHTPYDGDTLFALSTGKSTWKANVALIGTLAAEAVARAVIDAVRSAAGLPGYPAARDIS